jgi:3-carboxy-cis,cis-muconate cycloisomerase
MQTTSGGHAQQAVQGINVPCHTMRDNFAEVGAFVGIIGGSLGKIAMDVKLLMQTAVAEPFAPGRGLFSSMQ